LYPDLDLWQTAKPQLERWMSEQVGVRAAIRQLRRELPAWGERLPELPGLVHELAQRARDGKLEIRTQSSNEMRALRDQLERQQRRTLRALAGAALTVSAALLHGLAAPQAGLAHAALSVWLLGAAGLGLLASALTSR
ncbi:MAG: ubiquinone biosynthesis regulatory protein kinase UbiB, partial [Halofilum sp. (in: g-proteobacteria)]